jgi:hypothetical protein
MSIDKTLLSEGANMTSPTKDDKDTKTQTTPHDDDVPTGKPSEDKRELTDDEIAKVAGGMIQNFPISR